MAITTTACITTLIIVQRELVQIQIDIFIVLNTID